MAEASFLTVPGSGEPTRPFAEVVDGARRALPPAFPHEADKVMVALDIDGTVLTPRGASHHVRAGIRELAAAGAQVVIASGRAPEDEMFDVLDELGFTNGWVVCNNGATVLRVSGGGVEVVRQEFLDPAPLIDSVLEEMPEVVFYSAVPGAKRLLSAPFPPGELEQESEIIPLERMRSTPTPKLVVRAPGMEREEFDRAIHSLSAADRYEVFVGWTSWADIGPLGATKASALEWLRSRLGIPRDGTVAVGDGTNDIAMIEWAFFGAAMGGATEEVRACADHVTAAVENDGAAAVMRVVLERCGADGAR